MYVSGFKLNLHISKQRDICFECR